MNSGYTDLNLPFLKSERKRMTKNKKRQSTLLGGFIDLVDDTLDIVEDVTETFFDPYSEKRKRQKDEDDEE
jgi:hypothetical protein